MESSYISFELLFIDELTARISFARLDHPRLSSILILVWLFLFDLGLLHLPVKNFSVLPQTCF